MLCAASRFFNGHGPPGQALGQALQVRVHPLVRENSAAVRIPPAQGAQDFRPVPGSAVWVLEFRLQAQAGHRAGPARRRAAQGSATSQVLKKGR